MKLNIKKVENARHQHMVNSVCWQSGNEVISISDDKQVLKWDSN